MSDEPTVDITDVVPEAVVVRAHEVSPGDFVFDAYGGRHKVRAVNFYGSRPHHVEVIREDGWESDHALDETITIVRGAS